MNDPVKIGKATLYNMDCMELLANTPDKFYDLAIVDPPYGGATTDKLSREQSTNELSGGVADWSTKDRSRFGGIFDKYKIERTGGSWSKKYQEENSIKHWDIAPSQEYFNELARVSKNQIIWGGNYFDLPPTRCFLVWRKLTISEAFSMAMCEYAWTSFNQNAKWIEIAPQDKERFHPTQKPLKLYEWVLANYAKAGDKLLDTHLGGGAIAVAANNMGFDLTACELDKGYFDASVKRITAANQQIRMFE